MKKLLTLATSSDPCAKRTRFAFAAAFLIVVLAAIMRHLWGDGLIAEFHSDTTDTLLWAEASCEAGRLASPDFHYVYFIPFGGNLLMNAFIPFFGVGITTIRCGMTLAILIMCAASLAFFRSLLGGSTKSVVVSAVLFCLLCSTVKLREVFFSHVIHYSLAACFLMAACVVLGSIGRMTEIRRSLVRKVLFGMLMSWAASCGPTMLLYVVVPVLGGLVVWRMLDSTDLPFTARRDLSWLCCGGVGVLMGLAIRLCLAKDIPPTFHLGTVSYTNFYEEFCAPKYWVPNLEKLPMQWLTLFFDSPPPHSKIATLMGVRTAACIACGLTLAVMPALAWLKYRDFNDRARLVLVVHWILAGGILFYWVFGNISNSNWRLSPLIFTGSAICACMVRSFWRSRDVSLRRLAVAATIGAVLFAAHLPAAMTCKKADVSAWFGKKSLLSILESTGADYGYCSNFWFSNAITVLTNGRIKMREIIPSKSGGWQRRQYQSADHWYAPDPNRRKTVFVCYKNQEKLAPKGKILARRSCRQWDFRNNVMIDFLVFVYAGDFPCDLLK